MTNDKSGQTGAQDQSKLSGLNELQARFVNEEMRFLHDLLNRCENVLMNGGKISDFVKEIEIVLLEFRDLTQCEPKIEAERAKFLMMTNLKRGLTTLLIGATDQKKIDVGVGLPHLSLAKKEDVN